MNPKSGWTWRKYHLPRDFSTNDLLGQVQIFISKQYQYNVLEHYYIGKQDILNRAMSDSSKPNNRVVNNFGKLIVDTNASYFMGKPVTYQSKDEKTLKTITDWLALNNSHDTDAELAKLCSIMGHAFEFHWINKDGEHRFKYASARNVLAIYSADLDEELMCVVNIGQFKDIKTNTKVYQIEIYDDKSITRMNGGFEGTYSDWIVAEVKPHPFGEVPAIEYIANEERQGDFESILTQIDAYDQVVSDSVNDVEYWNDAYLLLRDLQATTIEDIQAMKENRILMVDGTGDAQFITRDVQDSHIENIKNRLVQDIHKHSQTPNLSDEQFATNLSGTAIRYKLLSLENRTSIRERKFTTGFMKRLRLAFTTLNLKGQALINDITPIFIRNLPANVVELADMAIKLKDIVSDETLRGQLPFITDLEKERELVAEQKLEGLEMTMFPTTAILPTELMDVTDEDAQALIDAVNKTNAQAQALAKQQASQPPVAKDPQGNGKGNGMNTNNLQKQKTSPKE